MKEKVTPFSNRLSLHELMINNLIRYLEQVTDHVFEPHRLPNNLTLAHFNPLIDESLVMRERDMITI